MIHPDEDQQERGSTRNHFETIRRLGDEGIALRCHPDYHAKFFVADGIGIISSANLLENSINGGLGARDRKSHTNYELGFVVTDLSAVKTIEYLFDAMWDLALYKYGITAEGYIVRPASIRVFRGEQRASPPTDINVKLSWTLSLDGTEERYLKQEIVRLLRSAKRDVLLSTMIYKPVEPIHGLLKSMARAGKDIVILVRESSAKRCVTSLSDLR
jgi:phosphatidylserine/phosphatidylglycerophosphate/cardiolipin synthase-like enzyme